MYSILKCKINIYNLQKIFAVKNGLSFNISTPYFMNNISKRNPEEKYSWHQCDQIGRYIANCITFLSLNDQKVIMKNCT